MLVNIKEKIKNKAFWGGVLTTIGGILAGSIAFPDAIIQLINLIGG